ncbi:MAG TPA: GTPase Era [Candidatus Caccopulliclostridium gallistercoris]|uniref:GTPase Era n=1 Tax=Candidatus Caccopulliclostridium gallistercoris TaxID=2840719 RepID=A0A9D1NEQ8_9FIRM|nr:GTPase Era [Candidatus Caccopulliclostridium gallistercoris]
MFKFGYVGVVGNTNAGKSTLVNALVGEKVSIVSPKKQTTRDNIMGILTRDNYQLVFVDTPGLHRSKNKLDRYMMKNVRNVVAGVDVILYVVDGTRFKEEENDYIKKLTDTAPTIVGISKVDAGSYEKIYPIMSSLGKNKDIKAIIPFSSYKNRNLDEVIKEILKILPEQDTKNFEFDEDMYTDKSVRFMAAEIIREKALLLLNEELPHGLAINVTKFDEQENIAYIDVDIICERESHKSIVIGKHGNKIKEIATRARADIEEMLGKKVMLECFVKVRKNWRDVESEIEDLGYKLD